MMFHNIIANLNSREAKNQVENERGCEKYQVNTCMFVSLKLKIEKGVIPFQDPKKDHPGHQNQYPLTTRHGIPKMHKGVHTEQT